MNIICSRVVCLSRTDVLYRGESFIRRFQHNISLSRSHEACMKSLSREKLCNNFVFQRRLSNINVKKLEEMRRQSKKIDYGRVPEDVILFSDLGKERLYKWWLITGGFLCLMVMNSAHVIYLSLGKIPLNTGERKWYQWWRMLNLGDYFLRNTAIFTLLVFGCISVVFSIWYPSIVVKNITLLRGGENVIITTYSRFESSKELKRPLNELSAQWSEKKAVIKLPVHIKGYRWNHILHTERGKIHNKTLYDTTIALKREFKN